MGGSGGGEAAASGGGGRALAAGDLSSIVIDEITGEPILAGAPGAAGPAAGAGGSGRRPGSTTGPRTMAELGGLAEQGRSGSSARLSTGGGGGGGGLGASASTASKLPGAPAASGGTAPGGAKRGGTAGAAAAAGGKAPSGTAAASATPGSSDAGVTPEAPGSSRSQGQQLPTFTATAAQHSTTALRSVLSVRAWPGIPSLALREGVPAAVTAGGTTPVVSSSSSSAAAASITPRLAAAAATIGAVTCRYTPWSRHAVRARDEAAAALAASLRGAQTEAVNALFAEEAAATEEWVAVWVARVSSACAHLGLNYDALLPPPGSAQAMPAPPAVTPTGAGRPPSRGSSVGAAAAGKGSKPPASGAHGALPPQGKR